MTGCEEAFPEVAADDLLGVADGSQVGAGVPFKEEVEVGGEPGDEGGGCFGEVGFEEVGYGGFWEGGHCELSIAEGRTARTVPQ